jgi:hypothetical protein
MTDANKAMAPSGLQQILDQLPPEATASRTLLEVAIEGIAPDGSLPNEVATAAIVSAFIQLEFELKGIRAEITPPSLD